MDLSGMVVAWSAELFEYGISFVPRSSIKYQTLANFLVEFSTLVEAESPWLWFLSVNMSSNLKGSGAWIMLEGPDKLILEQSLYFNIQANNNQDEYEALIVGMKLPCEVETIHLRTKSDSHLVNNQVKGDYIKKEPSLAEYLQ